MFDPRTLWSPVEVRAEIAATPDEVFDVLAEPRTYPQWLVGAKKIRDVDSDFPAKGAEFDHTVGAGPVSVDDSTEVLEVHRPDRLVLLVRAGHLTGEVEFLVLPSPKGTEVRFRERPIGLQLALTPFLRLSLQARNGESLKQLRELIEAHGSPAADVTERAEAAGEVAPKAAAKPKPKPKPKAKAS
jgi:uncharacterized protein YndB with AHSA1/START domain